MLKYIAKNILMIFPTLLGIVFIVFSINQLTPGDPVVLMLGIDYTEEQYEQTEKDLGLDQPFFVQFYNYLKNIVTKLDFGTSYTTRRPVMTEVGGRVWTSMKLGILATLVVIVLGIPIGVMSATKQGSVLDYIVTFLTLCFSSVPNFWFSMIMILLFSLKLGWLPASGLDGWRAYIIPVCASSITSISQVIRQTRSSMLEVVRQDYIRTARAKGLDERTVIYKHALRNALIPIITLIGMNIGMIFAGNAVVESIQNLPGMGTLLLTAINGKDYPTIQGIVLILSSVVCLSNVLVDIVYGFVDPRIRSRYQKVKKKTEQSAEKAQAVL